jgi:hypothetical protein
LDLAVRALPLTVNLGNESKGTTSAGRSASSNALSARRFPEEEEARAADEFVAAEEKERGEAERAAEERPAAAWEAADALPEEEL